MTVSDIIEYVTYSDLSNLGIINNLKSDDLILATNSEKAIISYINLGLIELYKRFDLRTEETVVILSENITVYNLNIPTLNSIIAAYDEEGKEYELNSENDALSILTPSYNTIQVPNPVEGAAIYIIYTSAPDKILWDTDLTLIDVSIPPVLHEALLKYIGYRAHVGMGKEYQVEMQTAYNMFIKSCEDVKTFGVINNNDPLVSGNKLELKGFV